MRRLAFALLATLALAIPERASAQLFTWDYLCGIGHVDACINFSATFQYDATPQPFNYVPLMPEGVTRATFSVQNLQGLPGLSAGADPWAFTRFRFEGLTTTWATELNNGYNVFGWQGGLTMPWTFSNSPATMYADRQVQYVESNLWREDWEFAADRATPTTATIMAYSLNDLSGLFGCNIPNAVSYSGWYGGCGTTFSISMLLPGRWTMTDQSTLRIGGRQYGDGFQGSFVSCRVGVDCVHVPEPSSALLLATGLLGFAVVRRRRAT